MRMPDGNLLMAAFIARGMARERKSVMSAEVTHERMMYQRKVNIDTKLTW